MGDIQISRSQNKVKKNSLYNVGTIIKSYLHFTNFVCVPNISGKDIIFKTNLFSTISGFSRAEVVFDKVNYEEYDIGFFTSYMINGSSWWATQQQSLSLNGFNYSFQRSIQPSTYDVIVTPVKGYSETVPVRFQKNTTRLDYIASNFVLNFFKKSGFQDTVYFGFFNKYEKKQDLLQVHTVIPLFVSYDGFDAISIADRYSYMSTDDLFGNAADLIGEHSDFLGVNPNGILEFNKELSDITGRALFRVSHGYGYSLDMQESISGSMYGNLISFSISAAIVTFSSIDFNLADLENTRISKKLLFSQSSDEVFQGSELHIVGSWKTILSNECIYFLSADVIAGKNSNNEVLVDAVDVLFKPNMLSKLTTIYSNTSSSKNIKTTEILSFNGLNVKTNVILYELELMIEKKPIYTIKEALIEIPLKSGENEVEKSAEFNIMMYKDTTYLLGIRSLLNSKTNLISSISYTVSSDLSNVS